MHQFADIRRASRRAVHVDDMRSIAQKFSRAVLSSTVRICIFIATYHVVLGDENDIRVVQLAEILAGLERVRIHKRGIIPRPFRLRAMVGALNLDVVFPTLGIPRENIETDTAPLKVLDRIFGLGLDDLQIFLAKDNPQYQLDAFRRVL